MTQRIIESRNKREGGYAGRQWIYNISLGRRRSRHCRTGLGEWRRMSLREWGGA